MHFYKRKHSYCIIQIFRQLTVFLHSDIYQVLGLLLASLKNEDIRTDAGLNLNCPDCFIIPFWSLLKFKKLNNQLALWFFVMIAIMMFLNKQSHFNILTTRWYDQQKFIFFLLVFSYDTLSFDNSLVDHRIPVDMYCIKDLYEVLKCHD